MQHEHFILRAKNELKRPVTRRDCINGPRPCPWISCKHHMIWGFSESRNNKKVILKKEIAAMLKDIDEVSDFMNNQKFLNFIWDLDETCTLDVADRGGAGLAKISGIFGCTKQGIEILIREKIMVKLKDPVRMPFWKKAIEKEELDERRANGPSRNKGNVYFFRDKPGHVLQVTEDYTSAEDLW